MKTPLHTLKILLLTAVLFCIPTKQLFCRNAFTDSLLTAMWHEPNPVKQIELSYLIGNNYKQKHSDSARIFFKKGLINSIALRQDSLTGTGYFYLATSEAKRSNYRAAINYADSALKYMDNTQNALPVMVLKKMKSDIYLAHLNAETKLNRTAIKKQERTSNILFAVVIIMLLFSALLFNRYQLKKKIEKQQALLDERKRISHELHDDLGSQLCAAKLFLNNLKNNLTRNSEKDLVDNSISLLDGCIKDLRFIMNDLQTPVLLENGYIAATTELVNKVNQLKQINFSLSHNGIQERLEQKKENNLFRITQELINNTLKYAHAQNVTIDVLNRDNNIVLMYEDDGKGCNLQSARNGYGLNNIQSRSQSLGGTVAFDSYPGAGFRAIVEIPLLYA